MSTVECPLSLAYSAMNVTHFRSWFVFSENYDIGFDQIFFECCCLTHKSFHRAGVALGQHGGHRVPFGGKIEEREIILFGVDIATQVMIDRGVFVSKRVADQLKIFEGQGFAEIEFVFQLLLIGVLL